MRKKIVLIICVFICSINVHKGQSLTDLGAVWQTEPNELTTYASALDHIIKQPDSTYIAVGWINAPSNSDPTLRIRGYAVHFNEGGGIINQYILTPPNQREWTDPNGQGGVGYGNAFLRSAHITNDGDILLFGVISNTNIGTDLRGHFIGGYWFLQNGFWATRIKRDGTEVFNKLDRGSGIMNGPGIVHDQTKDQYLVSAMDYQASGKQLMVRVYNADGSWYYDNFSNPPVTTIPGQDFSGQDGHIAHVLRLPNGDYLLGSMGSMHRYNPTTFAHLGQFVSILGPGEGPMPALGTPVNPGGTIGGHAYWSLKNDGGVFASSRMVYYPTAPNNYGSFFFEKNASNVLLAHTEVQKYDKPMTRVYNAPFLLPGKDKDYVGTLTYDGRNYVYLAEDLTPGYTLTPVVNTAPAASTQIPQNGSLRATSFTDGFFASGAALNGTACLSKLSTCVSFMARDTAHAYLPFNSTVPQTLNRIIPYQGATGAVTYTLDIKVVEGTVNGKTAGQVLYSVPKTNAATATNLVDLSAFPFTLNAGENYAEVEYTLRIKDDYINNHVPQSCSQTYIFKLVMSSPSCFDLFSDDIWIFGATKDATVSFKQKNDGTYEITTESGKTRMNSYENSLSVSTPSCDGAFLFYASHDSLYNYEHRPMKIVGEPDESKWGKFLGHNSNADGLATAYIGNNKYVMVSVSEDAFKNNPELNYYIIDMSGDNGLGEFSGPVKIADMPHQSIEIIPKPGKYDEYWLLYIDAPSGDMHVVSFTATGGSIVLGEDKAYKTELPTTAEYSTIVPYKLIVNQQFTKLAMINNLAGPLTGKPNRVGYMQIFDFCPITGRVEHQYTKQERWLVYGLEFSPSGEFIYTAPYQLLADNNIGERNTIKQYEVATGNVVGDKEFNTKTTLTDMIGGGMKLGPDGKIYVLSLDQSLTAIENPDVRFTNAASKVTLNAVVLEAPTSTFQLSTGITRPWICPPSANHAPELTRDIAITYETLPVKVKPLDNDTDPDGDNLILYTLNYVDNTDATKLSFEKTGDEVVFTPVTAGLTGNDKVTFQYSVKDDGQPVQKCNESTIVVLVRSLPQVRLMDSCSFAPYLYFDISSEFATQWQKYDGTNYIDIAGETSEKYFLTDNANNQRYRVKANRVGETSFIYSQELKVEVENAQVINKTWWKVTKK